MKLSQINSKNVYAYIQGNVRYKLYYSKLKWLIPNYIREQIDVRINSMNPQCYQLGSCIKCGCQTTHLQMANKACEGNCYPKMLNRRQWNYIKSGKFLPVNNEIWIIRKNMFKFVA